MISESSKMKRLVMFKRTVLSSMVLFLCMSVTPVQAAETDFGQSVRQSASFADLKNVDKATKAKFDALISAFGNDVNNFESNKIPVTLTEPPVKSTRTPGPTNPNQS